MSKLAPNKGKQASPRSRFFRRYANVNDEHGFDPAAHAGAEPFMRFLFRKWFGVKIAGLQNIPAKGKAVLFGNHSGVLPVDGCLLYDGIINYHPEPRRVRFLVTKFLLNKPWIGTFLRGFGCIPPDYNVATDMLHKQELVHFYPEGEAGTGKLFKNRYNLVDFHAGFVRAAIETSSPLVPIVTIGGEEIYPMLADAKPLAKLLRMPYFPLTPFFPWFGLLGFIPLPTNVMICIWPAFRLPYPPEAAEDTKLVAQITEDIRADLQAKVTDLLAMRRGPFSKWNMDQVRAYLERTPSYTPSEMFR